MLQRIDNAYDNEMLDRFNKKIDQYNALAKRPTIHRLDCLALLQEINYMHMHLKRTVIDTLNRHEYDSIGQFLGVGSELQRLFGFENVNEMPADELLSEALASNAGLPTRKEWEDTTTVYSQPLRSVLDDLQALNELLEKLSSPPSHSQAQAYYYALASFKEKLLHQLAFQLDDTSQATDIGFLRTLLGMVHHEIAEAQKPLIKLQSIEEYVQDAVAASINQELSQCSSEKMDKIIAILNKPASLLSAEEAKKEICKILPRFEKYQFERLGEGNGNNKNWKIVKPSDPSSGLVFQVGSPSYNQFLLHRMTRSALSKYLVRPFFSSAISNEQSYSLSVIRLYSEGDLTARRASFPQETTSAQILQLSAMNTLGQLTTMCRAFAKANIIYPDIKLSNFLTDKKGEIVISDTKSFEEMDNQGLVGKKVLQITYEYAPPEYHDNNLKQLDGKAFMTYQLGLALYEYLTAKPFEAPLDFAKYPIFATEHGPRIQALIVEMTNPNPAMRPGLELVQKNVHEIVHRLSSNNPSPNSSFSSSAKLSSPSSSNISSKMKPSFSYRFQEAVMKNSQSSVDGLEFADLKARYHIQKTDELKSKILEDYKSLIDKTSSREELAALKKAIKDEDAYKFLDTAQKTHTKVLQVLGANTGSIDLLNKMFKERKKELPASDAPSVTIHL
jgi:hypothetical protein